MTDEEKKKAEEAAQSQNENGADATVTPDPIAEKDQLIAKLQEERDNYKAVALKRLGKLPADAEFMNNDQLSVADQVKLALIEKEMEQQKKQRDEEARKLVKENAELRLMLKNRPDNVSVNGSDGGGSGVDVKDNVISEAQRQSLLAKAKKLGADPEKFIENFKQNLIKQRR